MPVFKFFYAITRVKQFNLESLRNSSKTHFQHKTKFKESEYPFPIDRIVVS